MWKMWKWGLHALTVLLIYRWRRRVSKEKGKQLAKKLPSYLPVQMERGGLQDGRKMESHQAVFLGSMSPLSHMSAMCATCSPEYYTFNSHLITEKPPFQHQMAHLPSPRSLYTPALGIAKVVLVRGKAALLPAIPFLEAEAIAPTFSRSDGPGTATDGAELGFLAVAGFAFMPVVNVDECRAATDVVEAEVAALVDEAVLGLQAEPRDTGVEGRVGRRESETDGHHHHDDGEEMHDFGSALDRQW